MPRTKGSTNKHKKIKPHDGKEKKKRGRPKGSTKQQQHQVVNIHIDNNGDGEGKKKKHSSLPETLASTIFNPSLVMPNYGINDRQPVNPPESDVTGANDMTNLILTGIGGLISHQSSQAQQVKPQPQPRPQPAQPPVLVPPIKVPITPTPKVPVTPTPKVPVIPTPKPYEPANGIDIEKIIDESKKNADKHKNKEKIIIKPQDVGSVTVGPIPQDKPEKPNDEIVTDVMGFDPKYDGLKLKNRTIPWSSVGLATGKGVALGVGLGLVGGQVLHNVATTAATSVAGTVGATVGYQIAGPTGAYIGSIGGASLAAGSGLMNRGGTGSVTMTQERAPMGRGRPIVPRQPRQSTAIELGGMAAYDTANDAYRRLRGRPPRPPVQEQVRNSQLLLQVEAQMESARALAIAQQGPLPGEISSLSQPMRSRQHIKAPSYLSSVGDSIKSAYRRVSGGGGGTYAAIPTEDDFKTTLKNAKSNTQGTYAILPQEEDEGISTLTNKTKMSAKPKTLGTVASADDPVTKEWAAMKRAKAANERNIRASIDKTNQAELESAIKRGIPAGVALRNQVAPQSAIKPGTREATIIQRLVRRRQQTTTTPQRLDFGQAPTTPSVSTPTRTRTSPQLTPMQQIASNNLGKLTQKLLSKQNRGQQKNVRRDTAALVQKRLTTNSIIDMGTRVHNNHSATALQRVVRGHQGRTSATSAKITRLENQTGQIEQDLQDQIIQANRDMHGPLREERKRLQNKMSDHRTRGPTLTRYQMAKTKEGLKQYEDIIIPDRRGPSRKEPKK